MIGRIVWWLLRKIGVAERFSDEVFVRLQYWLMTGRILHLKPPRDFNDKIQWIKLYCRDPRMVVCADKYAVREFVRERIGDEYLNECYGVYDRVEDIDFDSLPNSFVLKGVHGSAMNLICHDKTKLDLGEVRCRLRNWLNMDFSRGGREWHYGAIKPRIICEKLIVDPEIPELRDYKMLTFAGVVKYIWVEYYKNGKKFLNFYDADWKFQHEKTDGLPNGEADDVERPACLDEMLELAKSLANDFPQCRVDFYLVERTRLVFGELTFTCGNGCNKLLPRQFCKELGDYIALPAEKKKL